MPSSTTVTTGTSQAREQHLLQVLSTVSDPRRPRGVRFSVGAVLGLAVLAVTCGARSFAAIGQWVGEVDPQVLSAVGIADRHGREESTFRRVCALVDADELDRALGAYWWTRSHQVDGRRVIAIDGKTVRGARTRGREDADGGVAPHLVAAFDHATGAVVGQAKVDARSTRSPVPVICWPASTRTAWW